MSLCKISDCMQSVLWLKEDSVIHLINNGIQTYIEIDTGKAVHQVFYITTQKFNCLQYTDAELFLPYPYHGPYRLSQHHIKEVSHLFWRKE